MAPRISVCPSFVVRKIDVGPSAPPMIPIAAACAPLKPNAIASMYDANTPNCAAAPIRKLIGLAIRGPKSVMAPTPMKMRQGKIDHSSSCRKYQKIPPLDSAVGAAIRSG